MHDPREGCGAGPPRLAVTLLTWLLPEAVSDAIVGDLTERYERRVRPARGRFRADLWFWFEVFRARPLALRRTAREAVRRRGVSSTRDSAKGVGMGGWWQDFRQGIAGLTHAWGYGAVVVGTVAVAVGATTLVFTIVDGVLLKPLPYREPARLVQVWQTNAEWAKSPSAALRAAADEFPMSYPLVHQWSGEVRSLSSVGAYARSASTFTVGDLTRRVTSVRVGGGLFPVLGATPLMGRVIGPGDDRVGAAPVVVLSYGFWQDVFGGASDALGRTMVIDGVTHTVVGVMPRTFYFPDTDPAFWYAVDDQARQSLMDDSWLEAVGRLAPGATLETASSELSLHPGPGDGAGNPLGTRVVSLLTQMVGDVRRTLLLLLAASALVVAVAAANVANLMLARGALRQRELAVRRALGAGTGRLVRMLFAETLVLTGAGGTLALGIALTGLAPVLALVPDRLPRHQQVHVDVRSFAFAGGVALVIALVAGLAPAVAASWRSVGGMLREGGRGVSVGRKGRLTQHTLIAGEIAFAFVLFVVAGVLGRSLLRMASLDVGFRAEGLLAVTLFAPAEIPDSAVAPLMEQAVRSVGGLPGVRNAAVASRLPFVGGTVANNFYIEGSQTPAHADLYQISLTYPATMGMAVTEGRAFTDADRDDPNASVVVSQALARRYFPGQDPVGRTIHFRDSDASPRRTIVGVVNDVRGRHIGEDASPTLYLPFGRPGRYFQIALRTSGDEASLIPPIRAAVRQVSPWIPVPDVVPMETAVRDSMASPRFRALLIGSLAVLAILLALAGVYALVSFSVASRTTEMGIRVALGARRARIVGEVLGTALRPAVVGIAVGVGVSVPVVRAVAAFLFEVPALDPISFGGAALSLAVLVAVAGLAPARRASVADPLKAMNPD